MIRDFQYVKPSDLREALAFLSKHPEGCKIICGGQSLLILLRQGLITPKHLVDIKHIEELDYLRFDPPKGLLIGAATTHREIEKSQLVQEKFYALHAMERRIASIQTRNWGTLGGNLCHGDPSSDPAVVLIAMGASVKMASVNGERIIRVEEFFLDYFETALQKDELLVEIEVPLPPARTAVGFDKFTVIENDMGVVSVAVSITLGMDGTTCDETRIVFGNAAPTPRRAMEAEKLLVGKKLKDDLIGQAGRKAGEESEPVSDIHASEGYRRYLVASLTEKMLRGTWEEARKLT